MDSLCLSSWRLGRHLLLAGVLCASLALPSTTARAQTPPTSDQGPRFNNWGPGQAAPDAEGPAGGESAAPSTAPGPSGRAAPAPGSPSYAPAPAPAPAPNPDRWGGCNYDLRGNWSVDGRQNDPWSYQYSANVYVRQFRGWLQIEQPQDGVSYYGVCRGNDVQLDVYVNGRFAGYQDGSVSGGGGGGSRFWNGGGLRLRAEWATFAPSYAAGVESWRRGGYGF